LFSQFFLKDKINICLSFVVFLASFVVYFLTMAPTVSFWDCGEFIATSYILGVPHPPGYPLFMLIGRIFTLLPIFKEVALRVNLLSVLSSALSIGICYLIIVRVVQNWLLPSDGLWNRIGKYTGGVAGSSLIAFSSTFWFNAVEAEVFGLTMLLSMFLVYLGLLWVEEKDNPKGDMLLVLISYLALLSPAIHMAVFLVMPAVFLLVVLYDKSKLVDWRFWITGLVFSSVMYAPLEWLLVMLFGWLTFTFLMLMLSKIPSRWVVVFLMTLAGIVGYSVQFTIPIRATQDPAINENNPRDWKSFSSFVERKQYGQQSMAEKMFYRRGSWSHQFGTYPHMGFWGFFRKQYNLGLERLANLTSDSSPQRLKYLLLGLPPFLFGILGIYFSIKRKWRDGMVLLTLFLLGTLGLILYMNFADGTRYDHWTGELIRLEVRDRDYFFTPGFMFFGLLAGVGVSGLLIYLSILIQQINKRYLNYLLGMLSIILLAWSTSGAFDHWKAGSRAGNYLPYDYAYNLLNSCDKDAILFTNGDNDTFPLWFLQQVEKIRTDVRVVNLSLLNTDWYILQLKHIWSVPISLKDDQIKATIPLRLADRIVEDRPAKQYYDRIRGVNRYLFPIYDKRAGRFLRVQDLMIEDIILTNEWKYPILFSMTVPDDSRAGLNSHLKQKGLVLQLVEEQGPRMMDPQAAYHNLFEVCRYRGLDDMGVYKDESTIGLLMNYPERFIDLAFYYLIQNDKEKSIEILERAIKIYPDYYRTYLVLSKLYKDLGNPKKEKEVLESGENHLKKLTNAYPEISLYHQYLGIIYLIQGKTRQAEENFTQRLSLATTDFVIISNLMQIYESDGKPQKALGLLEDWVASHPEDRTAADWLRQVRNRI